MAKQAASALERRSTENLVRFRSYADVAFGPRVHVYALHDPVSLTKQSFKDECDINVLMRRYQQSGILPSADGREPRYIDTTAADYQEAMFMVAEAKSKFAELPSGMRERFKNDPKRMLEFLEDPKNRDEAVAMGLVNPPKGDAKPLEVRVIADAAPVEKASVDAAPSSAKQK